MEKTPAATTIMLMPKPMLKLMPMPKLMLKIMLMPKLMLMPKCQLLQYSEDNHPQKKTSRKHKTPSPFWARELFFLNDERTTSRNNLPSHLFPLPSPLSPLHSILSTL